MPESERGPEKLFAALKVNRSFADLFLNRDTRLATINRGYMGQTFELNEEQLEKLMSLGNYDSPEAFARALLETDS